MNTEISAYEQQAIDFLNSTRTEIYFTYDGFKKYFKDDKQARNVFIWQLRRGEKTMNGKFGSSIYNSCKPTPILQTNEPIEIYAGIRYSGKEKIHFGVTIKTTCEVLNRINNGDIEADTIIDMSELEAEYNAFVSEYCKPIVGSKNLKALPNGIMSSLSAAKNYVVKRIFLKIEDLKKETVLLDKADYVKTPSAYDLLSCLTKYNPGTFEDFCGDYGYDTDSISARKTYKDVLKEWINVERMFSASEIEQLQEIA